MSLEQEVWMLMDDSLATSGPWTERLNAEEPFERPDSDDDEMVELILDQFRGVRRAILRLARELDERGARTQRVGDGSMARSGREGQIGPRFSPMSTPTLSEDQRKVLKALMDQAAMPADQTLGRLRGRTGLANVSPILCELEAFDPPLVEHDVDATLGTRFWWATNAAGDLVDAEL